MALKTKKSNQPGDIENQEKKSRNKASADNESTSDVDTNTTLQGQAKVNVVRDLTRYDGNTLEEQIDSLIKKEPVVMFNRTWCLFSVDAQNFLVMQMNVSVHSVEVDKHSQGKAIMDYVKAKTGYNTTPVIFIKGEFLGGFEQVNQLYSQGRLEEEYLKGLSHADRCEAFLEAKHLSSQPIFWFPSKVNAYVVRWTGVLTSLVAAASCILVQWPGFEWGKYLAYILCVDFVSRILAGANFSIFGRIAMVLAYPLEPKIRVGRPKQFASFCGFIFSFLGSLFFLLGFASSDIVGSIFMGGLTLACGMEGFLDFCLGCVFFRIGIQLGLISK